MPLVGTRMHRYSLRAEQLAIDCKPLNVRHITPARVTQRGYLIDINTQFGHIVLSKNGAKVLQKLHICKF
jgi:hypothetical protein